MKQVFAGILLICSVSLVYGFDWMTEEKTISDAEYESILSSYGL